MSLNHLKYMLFLLLSAAVLGSAAGAAERASTRTRTLQFGITPVILDQQTAFIDAWRQYLEKKLGQPIAFRQRSTYRQITDMLLSGELDFAWICGYPFLQFESRLELTVVPLYHGEPLYRAYLIVPARDRETRSITDLGGKSFAYSDPDSNSGFLVPQFTLAQSDLARGRFFRRDFFTWSHSNTVRAVAEGVADAGSVDGYVWDLLAVNNPELTAKTRIVARSPPFGFPPIVHPAGMDRGVARRMQEALLKMRDDDEGRRLLDLLQLDGFSIQEKSLFEGIRGMMRTVEGTEGASRVQPAP